MTFDDLPSAWQEENNSLAAKDREATIATVCRRVERIEGSVIRRDLLETIAALVVIFFFGGAVVSLNSLVAKIGAGFIVLYALFVIFKLHRTRTVQKPAALDAPVREFCRIELDRLDRQIQLGRSVMWWYIAPGIIGANMVYAGEVGIGIASLAYCVVTLLFAWGVYALNIRAVAKELVPPRDELANLLGQLEETGGT